MGEIVFKNICKSFGETKVIENLDLTIKDCEFTVLVGASGCGKTTLIKILTGLIKDHTGTVKIGNEEIEEITLRSYLGGVTIDLTEAEFAKETQIRYPRLIQMILVLVFIVVSIC